MTPVKINIDRRSIPAEATEDIWIAPDNHKIRRIDWPSLAKNGAVRGSLLFLPGRGDHYEKYLETLDYFARGGWNVTSVDWRGQGNSGRYLPDPNVGHIEDFSVWIADIKAFYADWMKDRRAPIVVIGHSMGGHLAIRAAVEGAIAPDALILSAPMLSIHTAGLPLWLNHAFTKMMVRMGRGQTAAWKTSEKPMSPASMRAKILTHDAQRYEDEMKWWEIRPEVKLGPPSWHWIERAIVSIKLMGEPGTLENMRIPTLILGTSADQLVSKDRIIADSKRLPNCELIMFGPEAAHELLRECDAVRDKCLTAIDEFLDIHTPQSA
jgi:lysophospholipase